MGSIVVLGGTYATFMPDDALEHADAIVKGEAEDSWERLLVDFADGKLERVYEKDERVSFTRSPFPRWDLIRTDDIMTLGVETSRGCPYRCEFCLVNQMFGTKMRYREVDDVIAEIESLPLKRVFFVADNFTIRKSYAWEIVRRLEPLQVSWVCQASIDIAREDELLEAMARAGCTSILVGFESLDPAVLKEAKKTHNKIEEFESAIAKIHSKGMHCLSSFIVGFDGDTLESFDRIFDFAERNNILFTMINALSVAPGTQLHDRIEREGRLCDVDRSFKNGLFPCIHYNHISQIDMLETFFDTLERSVSYETLHRRALAVFEGGAFAQPDADDVPLADKVTSVGLLLKRFLLTRDSHKRRLFLDLIDLVRHKKLAPEKLALFLLSMEAFNDYVKHYREAYLPEVRAKVRAVDKGPWAEQKKKPAPAPE